MGSWRKLLRRMAADTKPVTYSYDDVSRVLSQLGFTEHGAGGSHRTWKRGKGSDAIRVPMVDAGTGCVKQGYIKDMIDTLRQAELLDQPLTGDDDAVDTK